jgi:hypothetical protein
MCRKDQLSLHGLGWLNQPYVNSYSDTQVNVTSTRLE